MLTSILHGDNVADFGSFPSTGLIDSPSIELQIVDDHRALLASDDNGSFDPLGFYQIEQDKDEACTALADAFPGLTVSLHHSTTHIRIADKWQSSGEWSALVQSPTGSYHAIAANPTDAVKAVIKAHAKATAPVRATPINAPIAASTFESLGRVTDAPAFLKLLEETLGITSDITVEADGRVFLTTGQIGGSEAAAIGAVIAEFNMTPERMAAESATQTLVERRGEFFKAVLIIPNGQRVELPGVAATESDARAMARAAIVGMRSTVPAIAIVASESNAA
jgi:hypothetical protein